jgi:WD40 repeat protein
MLPTAVLSLDVTRDGQTVYAGCMDGLYRLDVDSGEHERLYGHESYVSGVALFQLDKLLVSSGYDGVLAWWDLDAGREIRRVKAHDFWSWRLARSDDGRFIASATGQYLAGGIQYEPAPEREPSVKIFNVESGELVHGLSHVPSVQSVAFSPDSRYVAAANLMGEVRVWDVNTGEQAAQWKTDAFTSWGIIKSHCYLGGVFDLTFTPDGSGLLLAGMGPMRDPMAGNGKQLWQRFAWQETPPRKVDETHEGESGEGLMEALAVHPEGDCFVMSGRLRGGSWNTAVFSLADGSIQHSFKTESRVTGAAFAAGGRRLLLGGTRNQPLPKDGAYAPFGHVDLYEFGPAAA